MESYVALKKIQIANIPYLKKNAHTLSKYTNCIIITHKKLQAISRKKNVPYTYFHRVTLTLPLRISYLSFKKISPHKALPIILTPQAIKQLVYNPFNHISTVF